jgi:L-lactate dehydrogenase complex protein LldG
MSSREKILQAVKQNKPAVLTLPTVGPFVTQTEGLLETYRETLTAIGGGCYIVDNLDTVKDFATRQKQQGLLVINGIAEIEDYNINDYKNYSAQQLENLNTVIIRGKLAVAENGSVWVTESNMVNRVLPFIAEHLILIIDKANIVANMHEAYKRITIDEEGYGVFIAGPSKTADIEQSLVVGAHGPLSLQVYVV